MHLLHPGGARVGHVDVDLRCPHRPLRRLGRSARSCAARGRWRRRSAGDDVGGAAAGRDAERDVAAAARALRSAARTPARTRSRWPTLVSTLVSVVSASAATGAAFALEPPDQLRGHVLRVGGAAAVAEDQHLAARRASASTNRRGGLGHRLQVHVAHPLVHARCSAVEHGLHDRDRLASSVGITRAARDPAPPRGWRRTPPASPAAARRSSPASLICTG